MQPVRSYLTRLLHLAILMVVIHQLLTSTVMEQPTPGDDPELPYSLHTWIGTGGLFVLMLFWLWTLVRDRAETRLSQLVPWFSPSRLQSIGDEALGVARDIVRLRAPSLDVPAISSAVHGLGMLLATFLAASAGPSTSPLSLEMSSRLSSRRRRRRAKSSSPGSKWRFLCKATRTCSAKWLPISSTTRFATLPAE